MLVSAVLFCGLCLGVEQASSVAVPPEKAVPLIKVDEQALLTAFAADFANREELLPALDNSIGALNKPSAKTRYPVSGISYEAVLSSLAVFRMILVSSQTAEEFAQRMSERFDLYCSCGADGEGKVIFTGYWEPVFGGSRERNDQFRYPLYKLPPDLAKAPDGTPLGRVTPDGTVPYYTREEIERDGKLDGKGLEIVYLADRFEAFLVHIQGSALIKLPDGTRVRLGYAGKTDIPYSSVGEALIAAGKLKRNEVSIPRMREYFREHPEDLDKFLYVNKNYVFFKEGGDGPLGCLGVKLTPMRSIATDRDFFPIGALAFIATEMPDVKEGNLVGRKKLAQFVLDQDAGGAIQTPGRVDIFMGTGADAETAAGHQLAEGKLYYLFLKKLVVQE